MKPRSVARLTGDSGVRSLDDSPAPALSLVLFRETDLAAVAEHRRLRAQNHFTDVREVPGRSGELARATCSVDGIGDDREKGLRERSGRRHRRIDGDRIARFRDPMMLDMKRNRAACAWLRRALERCTDRAPQTSRCRAQGVGKWINRAEVGHDRAAYGNAMTFGAP